MTLVVVDMQMSFSSSYQCLHGVMEAIAYSKKNSEAILLLEYEEEGETNPNILYSLRDYPKYAIVEKSQDDGGFEAYASLCELNADLTDIKICGVNACYCVASTARTLARLLPFSNIYSFSTEVSCCCWEGREIRDCMLTIDSYIKKGRREGKNDSK